MRMERPAMDDFLASVERQAFRMAGFATRNDDEALDIVQDAMLKLVRKYSNRSAQEWPPLFYRILSNAITDWHRQRQRDLHPRLTSDRLDSPMP